MGKNPKVFLSDRLELGQEGFSSKDFVGAIVVYRAVLDLKNDPETHRKVGDATANLVTGARPKSSMNERNRQRKSKTP